LCPQGPEGAYKENIQREKSKKERIPNKHKINTIYIIEHARVTYLLTLPLTGME
jgi:hypothetical protein